MRPCTRHTLLEALGITTFPRDGRGVPLGRDIIEFHVPVLWRLESAMALEARQAVQCIVV